LNIFPRTTGGDIVAVLLNSISNRTDGKHEIKLGNPDPRVSAFGWILNELHNSFFDLVPEEVKKVIHMYVPTNDFGHGRRKFSLWFREILSVSTPHQRQGIASKMMNFSYPREKLEEAETARRWYDGMGSSLVTRPAE
ncbi:hypothetical protein COOONC_26409, partial [Cooperia oncophora]